MKKIGLSIVLFFLLIVLVKQDIIAQDIEWVDMEEAVKLNEKTPRKFMIYVYSDNCGWCRRMAANTFENPVIANYINENYYPVKLNSNIRKDIKIGNRTFIYKKADPVNDTPAHHELIVLLLQGRLAYPSVAFMDENLTYLGLERGYKSPQSFEPWLHFIAGDVYKENNDFNKYLESFKGEL